MGHADYTTTQKYYIFVSDARKKQEYELAWGLKAPQESTKNNIYNILVKEFQQIQKMWIQNLVSFTTLEQKNNTI